MVIEDPVTVAAIVLVGIIACVIIIYTLRISRKKSKERITKKPENELGYRVSPFSITKSIQSTDASHAKDELRILNLEREILSDAIRRLYEAHAEGKLSEQERERLASSYKNRMMAVKESMAKDETIVALHQLESMQEDLLKLFSDRFGDLALKVEDLRSKIDVESVKEIPVKMPKPPIAEDLSKIDEEEKAKPKRTKKASIKPSPKSEAERRIEEIRNEVEKVLDKLGQMEIES